MSWNLLAAEANLDTRTLTLSLFDSTPCAEVANLWNSATAHWHVVINACTACIAISAKLLVQTLSHLQYEWRYRVGGFQDTSYGGTCSLLQ